MSSQNGSSCCLSIEGLVSMYSNLLAGEQEGPFHDSVLVGSGPFLPVCQLQASDVHLHPIIEGEDGGGAGAGVASLFHIADGLIEVFPTRQASNRQSCGSWALRCRWCCRLLRRLLLPLQSGITPSCAVIGSCLLTFPVGVDSSVRGIRLGHCTWGPGPVSYRLIAGLLLGTRLALNSSASAPWTCVSSISTKGAWEGLCSVVFHRRFLLLGFTHDGVGVCNLRTHTGGEQSMVSVSDTELQYSSILQSMGHSFWNRRWLLSCFIQGVVNVNNHKWHTANTCCTVLGFKSQVSELAISTGRLPIFMNVFLSACMADIKVQYVNMRVNV